jgi:NitT/TauT family transport system substrate-binding protein
LTLLGGGAALGAGRVARPAFAQQVARPERVTIRLSWVHDLAYAGLYLALDNGHFARAGLDVTLAPGGFGLDPIRQVAGGGDQLGIAGVGNLLLARAQGVPIVAVSIYFQRNGVAFTVRGDSGIRRFADFRGRRIGIQTGTDTDVIYRILARRAGLSVGDVREVPIQFDMTPFLTNQIDILPGYVTNQPVVLRSRGLDVNVITGSSEGLDLYGSVFFTTERLIRDRPDLVRRLVQSIQLGWQDAFSNKEQVIAAARRWAPEFDASVLPAIYDASMPFIMSDLPGVPINGMNHQRWQDTMQALREVGMLRQDIDLRRAYTEEFIRNVY